MWRLATVSFSSAVLRLATVVFGVPNMSFNEMLGSGLFVTQDPFFVF